MPRKRAADFDQSFLDLVEAPPSVYTAEQEAATKIDRRHKRRVKDYYPIYSDNPGGWQADLMFLPYTNSRNETRLHAILCVININSKYAFARMLPFTSKRGGRDADYDPSAPLDETGQRGVNVGGVRYEVKITGQSHSQAKVIGAMSAILDVDAEEEKKWLETKIPKDEDGKVRDKQDLWKGGDLNWPNGKFLFKTIYTDAGGEFGKQFDDWCMSRNIKHTVFGPTTGKKTRLGIVERFNRTLREMYFKHIDGIPRENLNHYFTIVLPQILKIYNRGRNHLSIEKFEKWKRGMTPSQSFPKGLAFTPKFMMSGGNRLQWIDWKKKETERVADLYKGEEAYLSTKPKASYFKGILHIKKGRGRTPYETKDPFGKSTQGTYSKPYQILKKNTNKNPYTGKLQDAHSFLIQSDTQPDGEGTLRLMPYDLDAGPKHIKHKPKRYRPPRNKNTEEKIRIVTV